MSGIILRILALIIGLILGTLFLKYNYQLTQLFGHNYLAEKYLGDGGTYSMWKLLGIAIIILAVIYAF